MEGLTWANVVSLAVAACALAGTAFSAILLRRSTREKTTADLTVNSVNATVEASKVNLTDRQYQAQREQMAADIVKQFGENYSRLLADANTHLDRLTARVEALEKHVAECEAALVSKAQRIERIELHARLQGWELP